MDGAGDGVYREITPDNDICIKQHQFSFYFTLCITDWITKGEAREAERRQPERRKCLSQNKLTKRITLNTFIRGLKEEK